MRGSARCRCGAISRSACATLPAAEAWSTRAQATGDRRRAPPKKPGGSISCTARRTRCCRPCSMRSTSTPPQRRHGSSATATAARSHCCMPRASRIAWPVRSCWRRTSWSSRCRSRASRRRAPPTSRPTCASASRSTTTTRTRRSGAGMTSGCTRHSRPGRSRPNWRRSAARCWRCRVWTTSTGRSSRFAASRAACRRPNCSNLRRAAIRRTATSRPRG